MCVYLTRLKKARFFQLNYQMELTYVTIVVLASMIFVLSGMVGYLYWQQTRMLQHIQSLAMVVSTHIPKPEPEAEPEHEAEAEEEGEEVEHEEEEEEEDDRITVEVVEGPPAVKESEPETEKSVDVDDIDKKTAAQLREMLTAKGIPFGKRDAKPVLVQLLKATA